MNKNVINAIQTVATQNHLKIDINNLQTNLKDLGIDSLAMMSLIFNVEKILKVQIKDADLLKIKNLGDLIVAFEKLVKN